MDKNLIVDVGMHRCEDTDYYLHKGFKVISVDADPTLVAEARERYQNSHSEELQVLNLAISEVDDELVEFNISNQSEWSSLKSSISDRKNAHKETIEVKTSRLSTVFSNFQTPFYCKIDIEGYDIIALRSLRDARELPEYISVETECIGEGETISDEEALQTLDELKNLGYSKFKLVDQISLSVLPPKAKFYTGTRLFMYQLSNKFKVPFGKRKRLKKKFNYTFANGATGPFGADLDGEWMDYPTAKSALLKHRSDYFSLKRSLSYGFWCDWHATKS